MPINNNYKLKLNWLLYLSIFFTHSCKKLVSIREPVDTITTNEAFGTEDQANSAIVGIYSSMNYNSQLPNFANGAITIYTGMSSDELIIFASTGIDYTSIQNNTLQSNNGVITTFFWTPAYKYIYQANAAIAALPLSTGVRDSVRTELISEAKLIRAFNYFYLINLFGDVPLILTTDYNKTSLLPRASTDLVYQQIIADLKDAKTGLPADFSVSNGERIRPNRWAATALLARVYLYMENWKDAEAEAASTILNTTLFSLEPDLKKVFSKNSPESIWQLQQNPSRYIMYNTTMEGYSFIPIDQSTAPSFYLTQGLLNEFEPTDQRRYQWISSSTTKPDSITYYYPYKYQTGKPDTKEDGNVSEYYTILRLAEQYLIRAEARARQNDISGAKADIDTIRHRAGLGNTSANTLPDILKEIAHERQIELFSEWGHRWLDLKRTKKATEVLATIKPQWNENAQLYPIPFVELQVDPNLTQNKGY